MSGPDMSIDEAYELIDKHAAAIGEHFEAVQILATWTENGHSHALNIGRGNWYARQGMAHEFINSDVAQDAARQIAEQLKDREDG